MTNSLRKIFRIVLTTTALMAVALAGPALLSAEPTTGPSTAPTEPLIANGGFEQSLEGWDVARDGGMSLPKPEAAHSGSLGLRIDDQDEVKGASVSSAKMPTGPGKQYELKFWGRVLSGKNPMVYVQFYDSGNKLLTTLKNKTEISIFVKSPDWKEYTKRATAPENAATVRIWIHSPDKEKSLADFDDVTLTEVH